MHCRPGNGNGMVHPARNGLCRAAGIQTSRENGIVTLAQCVGVTYRSVDNDPCNTARLSRVAMISPSSAQLRSPFPSTTDIAGLGNGHRGMNGKIISRTHLNGNSRTRNGHVRCQRFDSSMQRTAAPGDIRQYGCLIFGGGVPLQPIRVRTGGLSMIFQKRT